MFVGLLFIYVCLSVCLTFRESRRTGSSSIVHARNTQKNLRDLDLWSMTLIFNMVLEVVEVHVRAKFNRAKCSGSWVIVFTEKKKT